MQKIVTVKPLPGHRLEVRFADGTDGSIDLSSRLYGPVFEPLRDKAIFDAVEIDEYGAIFWPNGADLAPDAIYLQLKSGRTEKPSA